MSPVSLQRECIVKRTTWTHLDGLAPRVGKEERVQLGAGHDRDQLFDELQLGERVSDVDLGMRDLFHLRGHGGGDGRVSMS